MGRTNSALAQHNPTTTLAQWLESLRRRSGLSWSQMARIAAATDLPATRTTLFRAAQGEKFPKWKTVQVFTRVCGGDEREAKRLWHNAARDEATRTDGAARGAALPPQFITEPWQLVHAMHHMRRENGNPTLRELEERATVRGVSFLPKSTVAAVLRGRMPAKTLLRHFVRCCGNVPEHRLKDWEDAWDRVNAFRKAAAGQAAQEPARAGHELTRAQREYAHGRSDEANAPLRRPAQGRRAADRMGRPRVGGPPPQVKTPETGRTLRAR
ncbi:hypothetical protein [Actinacidiphila acididurans]|uniref:HTH cro/C1-type domain-containing protein n=1 Tax=Actinacidiphila acididurans TaxID=2784346 RepID=A0ABS2TT80_9ACTN|nr:hypothetical protein [Actinacidiphila acididurans]MBM9506544.1 hypothetical protein [Actinacidiphila acididurans]